MRTRLVSLAAAAAMIFGSSLVVAGAHPGPHHGNNQKGLCTAYFNGSDQGREKKRQAPPFQALEQAAEENDQTVQEFCEGYVGGNPTFDEE